MYKTKAIRPIIFAYWFLLIYIVAALVWWFISLQKQNSKMADLLVNELQISDASYSTKLNSINDEKKRKTAQYIGEGSTFLAIILLGAFYVYRAVRRQLKLSIQQQNFMMAVTHELKTPIAITRLNLETLQKRRLADEQKDKLINTTLQEVNRLNNLCNNILLASQLDAGKYQSHKNRVDLSSIISRLIADFSARYSSRQFDGSIQEEVSITGDELLLELLISNLIENATKYSPKEMPIDIALSGGEDVVVISVADKGPGIPESEKEKVFDKFYRIGNETTRTTKGTGLGLYLCKQIAKDHRGDITVETNSSAGALFTVTLRK